MRIHKTASRLRRATQQGFSMLEIVVGLLIGLLTLLAIYQLYAASEARRRTVASTSQAQTAGAMALFAMERDIRSAGLGFGTVDSTAFGCTVYANKTGLGSSEFPFVPVHIVNDDTRKQLWVMTGVSGNMFAGARYSISDKGQFQMEKSNAGFQPGDVIEGTSESTPDKCLMMEVTKGVGSTVPIQGTANTEPYKGVAHGTGSYTNYYTSASVTATRNGGNNSTMLDSGLGEGMLYSLGPTPSLNVWSLENNQLMRYNAFDEAADKQVAVAQDVVDFVVEYGYDEDKSGKIDQSSEWKASLTDPDWSRVIAVRIAVLVRSSRQELEEVTADNPRWSNGSKAFSMTAAGDNWKHYRYRVYESVVPLRNTIWGQML